MKKIFLLLTILTIGAGCAQPEEMGVSIALESTKDKSIEPITEEQSRKTIQDYFLFIDNGKYQEAFDLLTPKNQAGRNFEKWKDGYSNTIKHQVNTVLCPSAGECSVSFTATENSQSDLRKTDYTFRDYLVRDKSGAIKIDKFVYLGQKLASIIEQKTPVEKLAAAGVIENVVKIYCTDPSGSLSQGSGTIIAKKMVLSNWHVRGTTADYCIIQLSEKDGRLSEEYFEVSRDLAFDQIRDYWFFEVPELPEDYYLRLKMCEDSKNAIGDKISVYGYPGISGGSITLTEGVLSSFEENTNDYYTSAKLEYGNSGGAAINTSKNCFIGVPTMVRSGELESLGVIVNIGNILRSILSIK